MLYTLKQVDKGAFLVYRERSIVGIIHAIKDKDGKWKVRSSPKSEIDLGKIEEIGGVPYLKV